MRVKGEGPFDATLMLIGEGPGIVESKSGRPFVGPSGAELDRYLNGYALPVRSDIYITNLFKEWAGGAPTKGKAPTAQDLAISEWELFLELETVKPAIIATLGAWSTKWFLGDAQMESCHGLLYRVIYCTGCKTRYMLEGEGPIVPHWDCQMKGCPLQVFYVLPVVHPAAGLHSPAYAAQTAYDLAQLSGILKRPVAEWNSLTWEPTPKGVYIENNGDVLSPGDGDVGLDTEGPDPAHPWGFSYSLFPGTGRVQKHYPDGTLTLSAMPPSRYVLHHYMHDKKFVEAMGGEIPEDQFDDTMVMAYLLGTEPQGLKALAYRHLGRSRPDFLDIFSRQEIQIGKSGKPLKKTKTVIIPMDDLYQSDPQVVVDYAAADADDALSLKPILMEKLKTLDLLPIYEIDRRVLPLYARMEQVGLPINMVHMAEFREWVRDELEVKTMLLQADYPDLNPASADQVASIMFEHLKLPGGKKTPSGKRFSTNDKIMEAMKDLHPFVAAIIDWRELAKHQSTFLEPLFSDTKQYVRDGRLFFQLLATRVVSGRLAAKNPNVLAFPKYTVLGKRFRRGIQAPLGRLLGSWDLNQIELRVLALDSGSVTLQEAFATGKDLHTRTAQKIFGCPGKEAPAQRVAAKATNFGIPMGLTEIGLAEQMRKHHYAFPELEGGHFPTIEDRRYAEAKVCQQWIEAVIADWGLEGYIKGKHAEARRFGYVRSRGGRIRFLPSVLSPNKRIREGAMRDAQAYGPQAGARWYMKQIEYRVWTEVIKPLKAEGYYIEPILDIHDDLLLEFDAELGGLLLPLIESMVAASFEEAIPITAKGSVGEKWSDL